MGEGSHFPSQKAPSVKTVVCVCVCMFVSLRLPEVFFPEAKVSVDAVLV